MSISIKNILPNDIRLSREPTHEFDEERKILVPGQYEGYCSTLTLGILIALPFWQIVYWLDKPILGHKNDSIQDRLFMVKYLLDMQRMSFRQQNKNPEITWRKNSRSMLLAAGLPDFVVDDERRWNYVLLHGEDIESGRNPEWITKEQAADLLCLIQSHYESRVCFHLFVSLEKRIGDKMHD